MAKPLTDSINALTEYINEVTGGTDTNLSDAVATLADGYGKYEAKTVTIESTATNALQCMRNIFETPESGYIYVAVITGKQQSLWVTDQFLGGIVKWNNTSGVGLRYRNSNFNMCWITAEYDAKVEIGDVFTVLKMPYV